MRGPLTPQQQLLIFNDYAAYGVEMRWFDRPAPTRLVGVNFSLGYALLIQHDPEQTFYVTPQNAWGLALLPVLYDLADVARLPEREDEHGDLVRPLVTLVRKMNIVKATEEVATVEVLQAPHHRPHRTPSLDLLVHTYCDETGEAGDDYQVFVGAFGEIQWRNMTKDCITVQEAAARGTGNYSHLWGPFLMRAYDYLRELHVAVGLVAEVYRRQDGSADPLSYEDAYHYERKSVQEVVNG